MNVTKTSPPPPPVPDPNERFTLSDLTRDELFMLGHLLDRNCTTVGGACALHEKTSHYEDLRFDLLEVIRSAVKDLAI